MTRLAVDFGTSNSAAALLRDGKIRRLPIEAGGDTLPTAVFFPAGRGAMRIGAAATAALIAGEEGRYMRALKSVLGLSMLHESRLIAGRRRTLSDVVTAFLAELRDRSEGLTGLRLRRVLSGRPVHFHTKDPARDAQAEADLRACYLAAGFDEVDFLPEPEAAARACHRAGGGIGLIVDIGGGTSDFSVFRGREGRPEVLVSHGIRLGGTDFDQAVSLAHAMPLLGLGGMLRRDLGEGLLPVPRAPFVDLATWAKIPFLYTPEMRRQAADLERLAQDRAALSRFRRVLDEELGHELAFAVERGKIAANAAAPTKAGPAGQEGARIGMEMIAPGIAATISPESLSAALAQHRAALRDAAAETLVLAGITAARVDEVILVGGSSLMRMVRDEMAALFPDAAIRSADAFTAVVDGLALAAADAPVS
jgi:hypothetical chaperone protein